MCVIQSKQFMEIAPIDVSFFYWAFHICLATLAAVGIIITTLADAMVKFVILCFHFLCFGICLVELETAHRLTQVPLSFFLSDGVGDFWYRGARHSLVCRLRDAKIDIAGDLCLSVLQFFQRMHIVSKQRALNRINSYRPLPLPIDPNRTLERLEVPEWCFTGIFQVYIAGATKDARSSPYTCCTIYKIGVDYRGHPANRDTFEYVFDAKLATNTSHIVEYLLAKDVSVSHYRISIYPIDFNLMTTNVQIRCDVIMNGQYEPSPVLIDLNDDRTRVEGNIVHMSANLTWIGVRLSAQIDRPCLFYKTAGFFHYKIELWTDEKLIRHSKWRDHCKDVFFKFK